MTRVVLPPADPGRVRPSRRAVRRLALAVAAPFALVTACADGGTEDRPVSDVTISASHNLFGVVGSVRFAGFPVQPTEVARFDGRLRLDNNSDFEITSGTNPVAAGDYAIEDDGIFTIIIPRPGQSSLAWQGGYGLAGDTGRLFLTDRFGNVGLYLGTRVVAGVPDLDQFVGDWSMFSLQVQFSDPALPNPTIGDVGRAAAGILTATRPMAMGDVEFDGTVGRSIDPSGSPAMATGSLAGFDGGEFAVALDVGSGANLEERSFTAGGDPDVIFGIENGVNNEVAGLFALVRERAAPVDLATLDGEWIAGIWTVFPLPDLSGVDAGVGIATIDATGGYRIDAFDNTGSAFSFIGDLTTGTGIDGRILASEQRFNETWIGAVSRDDNTIVLVDNVPEPRPNGVSPELNLIVLLRRDV